MKSRVFAMALAACQVPVIAAAASFNLDFGDTSNPDFGTAGNLELRFENVATGINASIRAAGEFPFKNGGNLTNTAGSVNGDARISVSLQETQRFTFSLFDSTVGGGFETLFDPGTDYDFNIVFYDIDGSNANNPANNFDVLTLFTDEVSPRVTDTTLLNVDTSVAGQVTFDGQNAPNPPTELGVEPPLTQVEKDLSVIASVSNRSTFDFIYGAGGENFFGSRREALIDGGELSFEASVIPLPAGVWLLLGGIGSLGVARRFTRPNTLTERA